MARTIEEPPGEDARPRGVLVVNLGSPDAPTRPAVRRFLAEFLGDPLVVDLNPVLWWLLRHVVILPLRSGRSAALYRRIWTPEGSPLLVVSRRQRDALARRLGPGWRVALGMRYGNPSIRAGLDELAAAGCRDVFALSMFPQFSRPTTGSVEAALREELARRGAQPRVRLSAPYFADPGFVGAQADLAREAADAAGGVDHHVLSFHGLPQRLVDAGDPYRDQCEATARALVERLGLGKGEWTLAFQSRFGREEWLRPYADEVVRELASSKRRVLVVCPAFTADCLETLDEIGNEMRASFRAAGGEELVLAPCVNDDPRWVEAMERLVREGRGDVVAPGTGKAAPRARSAARAPHP